MAKTYTYRDAVRLLGGQESGLVGVLDRVSSTVMLALGAAGVKEILGWFDPRAEVARLSHELVTDLRRRVGPARGRSRTEILAAAHSIIVVTAYFDVFESVELPFNPKQLKLTKADQLTLVGGEIIEDDSARSLLRQLLDLSLPVPTPYEPFERTQVRLHALYGDLSGSLVRFLTGLALWDDMDDTTRRRIDRIVGDIPQRAVDRYGELFRTTAAECPEFFVWASLQDHVATRRAVAHSAEAVRAPLLSLYQEVTEAKVGLSRLETLLSGHTERADLHGVISALAIGHRAALARPIIEVTALDADLGLAVPALRDAYIDPAYRMRFCGMSARPAEESWWRPTHRRDDLPAFLAGFLTSPYAADQPLVILGQPGTGKSVLTRVLAARLPQDDFVVVRVELRTAPANAPIQDQIETAIHHLTGERISYPDLVRSAGTAIPVIVLDGFDELLQSTGVSRSNYLEQVREFQQREADLGRSVAVVVTTRTVVAERARFPSGVVVIRLEPFADDQVAQWVDVWNAANADYYRRNAVEPLRGSSILRRGALAAQPLLLLMLALYDADGNALGAAGESLDEADLYEGLLNRFARREIVKLHPTLTGERLAEEVETELERLAIVAFAMFNRGRQSVREDEVNRDVQDLLGGIEMPSISAAIDEPLTPAQLIVGRFFFIHESQASFKESRTRTYEFLHATFGEYLVARMVGRELGRLVRLYEADSFATARRNSGRLRALLSFAPLITRTPVVAFLRGILPAPESGDRTRRIVSDLIERALLPVPSEESVAYAPAPLTAPARHANLSVNAVLLGLICAGGQASAAELFAAGEESIRTWRTHTSLWKSQLSPDAWSSLVHDVGVERITVDGDREVVLTLGGALTLDIDLTWSFGSYRGHALREIPQSVVAEAIFLCSQSNDLLIAATSWLPNRLTALNTLLPTEHELVSEAQLLVLLGMPTAEEVPGAHIIDCCEALVHRTNELPETAAAYLDLVLNCYRYRLNTEAPLAAPKLLGLVIGAAYAEARHVLRAAECGLEEWVRADPGPSYNRNVKRLALMASDWLSTHSESDLTELWVIAVEAGMPRWEISSRLVEIEHGIRDSGREHLGSRVSPARLRRALRLSAAE